MANRSLQLRSEHSELKNLFFVTINIDICPNLSKLISVEKCINSSKTILLTKNCSSHFGTIYQKEMLFACQPKIIHILSLNKQPSIKIFKKTNIVDVGGGALCSFALPSAS